jgi:hypothetical protein
VLFGFEHCFPLCPTGLTASLPLVTISGIVVYAIAAIGLQLFREDYINTLRNETGVYDSENDVTLKNPSDDFPRWHFVDFQHSFLMIFRILCGEWIEPLWETTNYSGKGAIIFYLLVVLIGNFVVFNLLEHLQDEENISNAANVPTRHHDQYYKIWQKYDPDADQYIDEEDLVPFLSEIKPPLGFEEDVVAQVVFELGIPLFVRPPEDTDDAKGGDKDAQNGDEEMRSMHVDSDHEQLQAHCADILCALVRRTKAPSSAPQTTIS